MSNRTLVAAGVLTGVWVLTLGVIPVEAKLRKAKVGDKMPAFALVDLTGVVRHYQPKPGRVGVIMVISAKQKPSHEAAKDLKLLITKPPLRNQSLDLFIVSIDPADSGQTLESLQEELGSDLPIVIDQSRHLWGRMGMVVTPTVLIGDPSGSIQWIRAGHSYDYLPALRDQLYLALGISDEQEIKPSSQVRAVTNKTDTDRAKRHLQMGRLLAAKGRWDAAIPELRKAIDVLPESIDLRLELGQLYCRSGQSQKALDLMDTLKNENKLERSQRKMIQGWALRQLKQQVQAEKLLTESLQLNPHLARSHYELGKLYKSLNNVEKTLESYQRALEILFKEVPAQPVSQ